MFIPSILLKQLYTHGSLVKTVSGISFKLKNRLKDAIVKELLWITIDGKKLNNEDIEFQVGAEQTLSFDELNQHGDIDFPLKSIINVHIKFDQSLHREKYQIGVSFKATPFGT